MRKGGVHTLLVDVMVTQGLKPMRTQAKEWPEKLRPYFSRRIWPIKQEQHTTRW